ncbi:hypothetical protein C2S51_001429, partial [Perilla frutescens var. frutescens]
MVRRRIIVRHSGRWYRAQYVDGVEELIIMSSDDLCFRSLIREIHELLETDPTSVEYKLSWMSSTNSGRQIKTRLKDDVGLLDLLHEQSQDMVVYVVQRGCSSSRVIPDTVPEYREPVREEVRDDTQHYEALEHDFDDDAFPHEEEEEEIPTTDEEAEENDITGLLESMFTEFIRWVRSTGDVAGPLSWDEPSAANTDELRKDAIFRTKDDLALAMGLYHMQNRVEYVVYRSNKERLIYMCKHGRECPFKLCAVVDGVVWIIYKFDGTHTCHMDMSRIAPRQMPARVIAKYFARKLVDEAVVLKPKEMVSELLQEYGIQIDYSFALRLRNIAIEMVYGDYDKSYAQLLHKSIKNAVATVFPRAAHGLCYYHLQNKMARRGASVVGLFKEAAYAYQTDIFQRHMSALRLPICSMLESFRSIVEEWFVARRVAAQTSNHVLTDATVDKLSKN